MSGKGSFISDEESLLQSRAAFRLACGDREFFIFLLRRDKLGDCGRAIDTRIFEVDEHRGRWQELAMKLAPISAVLNQLIGTWPPQLVTAASVSGENIILSYVDPIQEYEKPVLPFGLDRESAWTATYYPKRRCWKLQRSRFLEEEGADLSAVFQKVIPRSESSQLADLLDLLSS